MFFTGQAHPSTQAGAGWSVLGHRAMWGHSSCAWLLLGTCRCSRGHAWVLMGCARRALLASAREVGQGSRAACGSAVPVPQAEQAPVSPRILNKFLDSYQEDVLPWHECVEPCVSLLSSHSSSWEVRGPQERWQAGVAVLAVPGQALEVPWAWDEGNGAAAAAARGPGSCQQGPLCSGPCPSRCCRRSLASCTAWAAPARTVWW